MGKKEVKGEHRERESRRDGRKMYESESKRWGGTEGNHGGSSGK